jgi:hypothetical protein
VGKGSNGAGEGAHRAREGELRGDVVAAVGVAIPRVDAHDVFPWSERSDADLKGELRGSGGAEPSGDPPNRAMATQRDAGGFRDGAALRGHVERGSARPTWAREVLAEHLGRDVGREGDDGARLAPALRRTRRGARPAEAIGRLGPHEEVGSFSVAVGVDG